ncbi:MAG: antitoxin [Ruminococcus sp.]|nr:antitoxin [Ruminococcus sp.]
MAKSQTIASNKYNAKAYDRVSLMLPKGQKEIVRQYAENKGLSLNGYINKLISDDMNATQSDSQKQDPTEQ